ncbi:hypothetical protein BDA99DRAFT_536107 [Phascolomyces articulosus]|uniref:Uncharacterized protein n=1 Tax=Phascolomyces articulosus TaxID=60185 RepID=A0AAD5PFL0_9FUNG|nr:hypothetical protein BDA99DRAFT_536107 [Phascolomyces articulosus]
MEYVTFNTPSKLTNRLIQLILNRINEGDNSISKWIVDIKQSIVVSLVDALNKIYTSEGIKGLQSAVMSNKTDTWTQSVEYSGWVKLQNQKRTVCPTGIKYQMYEKQQHSIQHYVYGSLIAEANSVDLPSYMFAIVSYEGAGSTMNILEGKSIFLSAREPK